MSIAGFSINVLTMLAVVLSVGLLVDDAIVMTENIYIRIERGMRPFEAGIEGAKEIFFAVISTTITLVAVFLPIVFMEGTSGRLFREFSLVVAGSVLISSFAALTFTPMLATKLLLKREKQGWFYQKTEMCIRDRVCSYARRIIHCRRAAGVFSSFSAPSTFSQRRKNRFNCSCKSNRVVYLVRLKSIWNTGYTFQSFSCLLYTSFVLAFRHASRPNMA